MSVSSQNSPISSLHRAHSGSSDGEHEIRSLISNCSETKQRPERMRDWLIRMINSGRFTGLDWLDEDKTVFKVPWIHAKKRGYNRERDAALFREWTMHSGKYMQDSDPTVWKINFRCAINGLKDIMEIKDMQTEDCRVYKVLPSRSKRRRPKVSRQRAEPYPTSYTTGAEGSHKSFTVTKSTDGTNIMPGISDHSQTSSFSVPPKQSPHFREAKERALVPFLFHHVLECDCSGQQYTIEDDDITLRIPKGAVSEGEIVHFEVGVAAYGPFHFPEETQPISPILWDCLLEESCELKKPFQLTVPHTISQVFEDTIRYHEASFVKASHNDQILLRNVVTYKFNHCDIEPIFTSIGVRNYGVLLAKHFCFYCLKAKQTAELAVDAGYSLVRVETSLTSLRHEIFFVLYFFSRLV